MALAEPVGLASNDRIAQNCAPYHLSGLERSPSFSPDGNQVAFAWSKTGRDDADIYIKQIGVEEPFQLTDDPRADVNPAWSPDGQNHCLWALLVA